MSTARKLPLTGTLGSAVPTAAYALDPSYGSNSSFNLSIWGTFVGTVRAERSFDGGTTWLPLTSAGVAIYTWTAPASETGNECEQGVIYRLNCTAYTSGTINYRISQ